MQLAGEVILRGSPICRGIAIGKPFFLNRDEVAVFERTIAATRTDREIERYFDALSRSKQDIKRLQKQLEIESALEGILILEAQLEMLQDPLLTTEIEKEVKKNKKNIEFIFQQAIFKYRERFRALNDDFFADRFQDLQDLARRVFSYLHQSGHLSLDDVPPHSIVCAMELTASDAASAHHISVSGFVTEEGGATTHAAIVARAKGIPYVANVSLEAIREYAQNSIIVDGRTGEVFLNPMEETLREYEELQKCMQRQVAILQEVTKWPAETFDGYPVRLCANLDMAHDVDLIHDLGGGGIGLFRSEYILLPHNPIPVEEEQFQIYSRLIERMKGLPVVIRTFDFGGDKRSPHSVFSDTGQGFGGCRASRFLLREQELFKAQLRAILRASQVGNVSILFPMIATLSEWRTAKKMLEEVRQELGLFHPVRVGCMIEVPSAALTVDHLARECDFLSVGTNDLVQYALAVDRRDYTLSEFYEPTDPSVVRLIKLITSEADKAQIPVSICGEIAADPRFTALLLGLGIQELSVAPRYLPIIKNAVRRTGIVDAVQLAEKALAMRTAAEVLDLLANHYQDHVPEDLFYPRL